MQGLSNEIFCERPTDTIRSFSLGTKLVDTTSILLLHVSSGSLRMPMGVLPPARWIKEVFNSLSVIAASCAANGPGKMDESTVAMLEQHYLQYRQSYNSSFMDSAIKSMKVDHIIFLCNTVHGWWFQNVFILFLWGRFPIWPIWVETTNYSCKLPFYIWYFWGVLMWSVFKQVFSQPSNLAISILGSWLRQKELMNSKRRNPMNTEHTCLVYTLTLWWNIFPKFSTLGLSMEALNSRKLRFQVRPKMHSLEHLTLGVISHFWIFVPVLDPLDFLL